MFPRNNPLFHDMESLCRLDTDRFAWLRRTLLSEGIPHRMITGEGPGHFILIQPGGRCSYREDHHIKTVIAHHDRVPGTPGANDNTAALVQLINLARSLHRRGKAADLEILLTDKEELSSGADPTAQGIYRIAPGLPDLYRRLFIVLDMTGRGDTVVLGEAGEERLQAHSSQGLPPRTAAQRDFLRRGMEELLLRLHQGRFCHLATLFSDDLGLLLRGLPVVQISLMPFEEALSLKASGDRMPPCWRVNHTPEDTLDTLEEKSFALMDDFLHRLCFYRFPLTDCESPFPASPPPPASVTTFPSRRGTLGQRIRRSEAPLACSAPARATAHLEWTGSWLRLNRYDFREKTVSTGGDPAAYRHLREWLIQVALDSGAGGLLLHPQLLGPSQGEEDGWNQQTSQPLFLWFSADAQGKPKSTDPPGIILWVRLA